MQGATIKCYYPLNVASAHMHMLTCVRVGVGVCEYELAFLCQSLIFLPTYSIQWKLCSSSQSHIAQ